MKTKNISMDKLIGAVIKIQRFWRKKLLSIVSNKYKNVFESIFNLNNNFLRSYKHIHQAKSGYNLSS